jgi:Ras-related protein Rab-11A
MNVVTILVGNKTDLKHAREVSTAEGQALAEAFQTVVKEIYSILSRKVFQSLEQKKSELQSLSNGKAVVLQGEANQTSSGGRWCCSS